MGELPICLVIFKVFHVIKNFLISYPILLKLVLIGLSDFSASIILKVIIFGVDLPFNTFHCNNV